MSDDRVFAKCGWRLIPFMSLLFLVNYLDRVNVGFAALTMNRDLGLSPSVFGLGAGLLFFAFFLFAVPSSVALERGGAKRWLFHILAIWGALSAATALVQGPASFYVLRFLLGAAEAGFLPGITFYLTYWFPPSYRARFTAWFLIAGPLSFILGGPLSSVILQMDGLAGLHGWQWLFVLEGSPALLLGFVVLTFLPNGPADAAWLSPEEKQVIVTRLRKEDVAEHRDLWKALRDPRVIALGLANLGILFGIYGVGLWLPQIVQAMGFSTFATGFVVAAPYLVSMATMILWGGSSDVRGERIWHTALPSLLAAAGFAFASLTQDNVLVLFGLTLAVIGVYATLAPLSSLPLTIFGGPAAAGGFGLVFAIASLGGFLGPAVIGVIREGTGGYAGGMAALSLGLVLAALIVLATGRAMASRKAESPSPNVGRG
jgi:ACS family tartrate transporter-like MFS transporter